MDSITFVTFSHTDYSDIWPLVLDGIEKLPTCIPTLFACNHIPFESDKDTLRQYYTTILEYNDSQTYPQKILQILNSISTPYICLVHDIDILVHIDTDIFLHLVKTVVESNMDRCSLEMFPQKESDNFSDMLRFTSIQHPYCSPSFMTPYDVGPSLWNVHTLRELMTEFQNETYRSIEVSNIQTVLSKKNVWGLTKHTTCTPVYQIQRPFPSFFQVLHILSGGKWFPSHIYQDLEGIFLQLQQTYKIDTSKRGIAPFEHIDLHERSI